MRLTLATPAALIGATVIHANGFWQIASATETAVALTCSWSHKTLQLSMDEFRQCRLCPDQDQVRTKYSRLIRAMRWASILSVGEATSAVYGYLAFGPRDLGSEAVAHVGGSLAAIRHAIRCRHVVARQARAYQASQQEVVCA